MPRRPPLEGIRVLDASSFLTGPFTAMMLADLGASVVKVERPPKGDQIRNIGHRYGGHSTLHDNLNRNKRSIFLDLRTEADRLVFLDLAVESDVVVQNWRPGVAESLGLGDDALAAANPKLVRIAITGFGQDGPAAELPAFDAVIQAYTGLADRQTTNGRPELLRTTMADKVTSLMAVQAVLAALLGRERSGAGGRVEMSMLDVLAYFNFPDMMETRAYPDDPAGKKPVQIPPSLIVRSSDGHLVVAPGTSAQLWGAAQMLGHPEWRDETRTIENAVDRLAEVMRRIDAITATEPAAAWIERFMAVDVPVAKILDMDAHLANEQVVHNGIYRTTTDPELGTVRYARYPARFVDREPQAPSAPAPGPGQHTAEIRAEVEARRGR